MDIVILWNINMGVITFAIFYWLKQITVSGDTYGERITHRCETQEARIAGNRFSLLFMQVFVKQKPFHKVRYIKVNTKQ